jgi:hypothetical protein
MRKRPRRRRREVICSSDSDCAPAPSQAAPGRQRGFKFWSNLVMKPGAADAFVQELVAVRPGRRLTPVGRAASFYSERSGPDGLERLGGLRAIHRVCSDFNRTYDALDRRLTRAVSHQERGVPWDYSQAVKPLGGA